VQHLWKKIWRLLKNLNVDLPSDPAIPLLGIYPKECNTGYSRGTCTPMFIAALFMIATLWEQPRCPTTDEWIMTFTQWNFTQSWRRMKSYSQINGWNWRTSFWAKLVSEDQQSYVIPHMWTLDLGQIQQCDWNWVPRQGKST
jgi:hypothetical protein